MMLDPPLRLVLDTNIWLDWLVFDDPGIVPIRVAVESARAEIYSAGACEQELARVLAYTFGKKVLDAVTQTACLARYRQVTRPYVPARLRTSERATEGLAAALPVCKDPDDQKFLELARDCGADFLVTKDRALLVFARRKYQHLPFRIVTPAQFASARAAA
jgi:putative PIN family toxin of toxin-antitoxin system